jgi:hypothetical protein
VHRPGLNNRTAGGSEQRTYVSAVRSGQPPKGVTKVAGARKGTHREPAGPRSGALSTTRMITRPTKPVNVPANQATMSHWGLGGPGRQWGQQHPTGPIWAHPGTEGEDSVQFCDVPGRGVGQCTVESAPLWARIQSTASTSRSRVCCSRHRRCRSSQTEGKKGSRESAGGLERGQEL